MCIKLPKLPNTYMQKEQISDLDEVKRQNLDNIAELILAYCKRNKITRIQFAQACGVSRRIIQEILSKNRKKGYSPTLDTLQAIYRILEIEDWLGGKLD